MQRFIVFGKGILNTVTDGQNTLNKTKFDHAVRTAQGSKRLLESLDFI